MMARRTATECQPLLISECAGRFPSTRYQGSKAKLADWIWEQVSALQFSTCLDAFGGTAAVAYRFKQAGKCVTYNDLLRFNFYVGRAIIENDNIVLDKSETDWLLTAHPELTYPSFVAETFRDIYFTDSENRWIDQTISNIRQLTDPYKFAIAFFALCQACIIKRPYNLFHRKNLYVRLADVPRSFGNKATWDRPFDDWFRKFIAEANDAVFANGKPNRSVNKDAMDVSGSFDLVYIDTPYISSRGQAVDYYWYYHFLEGLASYEEWINRIDLDSDHRRLMPLRSQWTDKRRILAAFDRLLARYVSSIIVLSYRSDGIPSEQELINLIKNYKHNVDVRHFGSYKYVLSKNSESREILFIGT